jgi:hypothetical protein
LATLGHWGEDKSPQLAKKGSQIPTEIGKVASKLATLPAHFSTNFILYIQVCHALRFT